MECFVCVEDHCPIALNSIDKKITLHEPCKTSYTGISLTSVREILCSIPKLDLIEMKRYMMFLKKNLDKELFFTSRFSHTGYIYSRGDFHG